MVGCSDPTLRLACLGSPHKDQSTTKIEGVYCNTRSRTGSAIASRSSFPPLNESQEGESDHEEHSMYASLEIVSSSQSRNVSINATRDDLGSLLQRLKTQEELAQQ